MLRTPTKPHNSQFGIETRWQPGFLFCIFWALNRKTGGNVANAKNGDKVKVNYTGKLSDGTEFDTSVDRGPLEFVIGEGGIIPGFENAVVGMAAGEKKSVTIAVEDAYGHRREELQLTIKRSELPPDLDPKVDDMLEMRQGEHVFPVMVTAVADEELSLDANHPLSGEELHFDIELVEIV